MHRLRHAKNQQKKHTHFFNRHGRKPVTLENKVKEIMVHPEHSYARTLVKTVHGHFGAAVGASYAMNHFNNTKKIMGDNIIAAFIYGGVARGLKDNKLPKDIDMIFIVEDGAKVPLIPHHRRLSPIFYNKSLFDSNLLVDKDNPESSFKRRILNHPILPLAGFGFLENLKSIVRYNYSIDDDAYFLISQAKKDVVEGKDIYLLPVQDLENLFWRTVRRIAWSKISDYHPKEVIERAKTLLPTEKGFQGKS